MTSQITKDFKMKSQLRALADGGPVDPAARAGGLLAGRGRQVDDAVDAATGTPAPAPVPAPAPAPAPQQVSQAPKKSGLRGLLGLADGGSYLDEGYNANRYQQSQLKDGGRVNGPGGRTDDKVGPVMLSDEEYVLPGDTADAIGRDKLDAIRLATHDFKDERKESALRGRADGGDGWYDDMMPMDHLADGGNPWIADASGNVRKPNAFGDAAAGPGYQQPRLPPPQPGTAVGPSAISPGAAGPRTINMGMVDEVPRTAPQQLRAPTAPTAYPSMGPVSNPNVGPNGSREAQAFRNAAPAAPAAPATPNSRAYNVSKAVGGVAGTAGRMAGSAAMTAPIAGFGDYKADTGGIDTSAAGTLGYLAKGEFGNAGTSLSGGAGEALADSGRGIAKTADWVAGLVGAKPDLTGKFDNMVKDKLGGYLTLRNPENSSGELMGPPESAKGPVAAATSALRSDQGAALPVTPDSYQSRRLSEMGVPLDVQNSKPVVDSVTGNTRDFLRTGGTSQFQNLGTYGGNGNIYGKADDPSRPGRINNFVGVGAGASPSNEASGSGFNGGASGALQSALRGLGSGSTAPGGPNSGTANVRGQIDSINKRYDDMLRNGRGRNVEFGSDWSQRHGINLEAARGRELADITNNVRSNDTSRANAQLSADTSRSNAELSARTSMLDTLGRMEQNNNTIAANARSAQAKALQDAQKYADDRQDKGAERTDKLIEKAFTSSVDGKDVVDRGSIAKFSEYLGSGKAVYNGKPFMALNEQERAAALPDILNAFRVNKAIDDGGGFIGGGRTSNSPSPLRVREAEIGDLVNGLGVGEYLGSKFVPGYDANVVERTSDRKVRSVEKVAGDDLERRKAILRNLATGN